MAEYAESLIYINPLTGDIEFDTLTNRWKQGPPAVVRAVLTLRTVKGSCGVDPTFGVDWKKIDKLSPNSPALARELVLAAMRPMVNDGSIRDLKVSAEMRLVQGVLVISLEFLDVRASRQFRVTFQQAV